MKINKNYMMARTKRTARMKLVGPRISLITGRRQDVWKNYVNTSEEETSEEEAASRIPIDLKTALKYFNEIKRFFSNEGYPFIVA